MHRRDEQVRDAYFNWLLQIIRTDCDTDPYDYIELLRFLYSREFYWSLDLDENRAIDGTDLRIDYIDENRIINADYIYDALGGPCSVLEMLIALARRLETHIMANSAYGDRTGEWFWLMVNNLGLLSTYDDENIFDSILANDIIDQFLNREYTYDGQGGLFPIPNPRKDLRTIELWYQMNWYFNEVFE